MLFFYNWTRCFQGINMKSWGNSGGKIPMRETYYHYKKLKKPQKLKQYSIGRKVNSISEKKSRNVPPCVTNVASHIKGRKWTSQCMLW